MTAGQLFGAFLDAIATQLERMWLRAQIDNHRRTRASLEHSITNDLQAVGVIDHELIQMVARARDLS